MLKVLILGDRERLTTNHEEEAMLEPWLTDIDPMNASD